MAARYQILRDSKALAFATMATWVIGLLNDPSLDLQLRDRVPAATTSPASEAALEGLIDASTAETTGAWWLDEAKPSAKLSFAPEYDRLVWRVTGHEHSVLLDAATGEALGFEF